ncbi:MAG: hypothetical protein WBM76_16720 [Woeseiaceae bacterium]
MTEPQIIPWKRIAVEATAIVISILLAFAIDAWWADKKERDVEHRTLQALRSDLIASNEELDRLLQGLADARTNFARFQSATPAELIKIDPEAVRPIVISLVTPASFNPITATHDALSNDGRLGLISDPELLRHLSNWQRALDDIEANSIDLHAESVRVLRSMEIYGGPFIRWRQSLDGLEVLQRPDGEVLAVLRQDSDFMGKARMHQYTLSGYLLELRRLDENLESMLALLDKLIVQD